MTVITFIVISGGVFAGIYAEPSSVTGQLADMPTPELPTHGLDNSRLPTVWT